MSKEIKTRIKNKHDLEVNWQKALNFIPMPGEIIIYDSEIDPSTNLPFVDNAGNYLLPSDRTNPYNKARVKIGNGIDTVNNLPFCVEPEEYYSKTEIDNMELITTADIDLICGTTIQMATASEVKF